VFSALEERLQFQVDLCYPASHKAIWLEKEKPFRDLNAVPETVFF